MSLDLSLPDLPANWIVAVDTEGSGLHPDDGARVSIVTLAWRDPLTGEIQSRIFPFDQGVQTPLGLKTDAPSFKGKSKKKPRQIESLFDEMPVGNEFGTQAPNLSVKQWHRLMEWLETKHLVFHNAKYDLMMIMAGLRGMPWTGYNLIDVTWWCTLVVCPLLWPEFPAGLDHTAMRCLGKGKKDDGFQAWLKNHGRRYDLAPWDLMEPYATVDAELCLEIFEYQIAWIEEGASGNASVLQRVVTREIEFMRVLAKMERRGIGYDAAGSVNEGIQILARAGDLERKILDRINADWHGAVRFKALNEHTVRAFWFSKEGLGITPKVKTDKGVASVTIEVVRDLAERGIPAAEDYALWNKLTTAASMWYVSWGSKVGPPAMGWHPGVENPQPRLRTVFKQNRSLVERDEGGTISGRLAVKRIQLQAIPHTYQLPEGVRSVREMFLPDPGFQLWELDLSQAEMRVAAGLSKCKPLMEAFARGEDAHDATTSLMFKMDSSHPDWKQRRAVAKRLNFGMLYGAGVPTIIRQIEQFTGVRVERYEVEEWLSTYRSTFPELGRKARWAEGTAEKNGFVSLAGGRERWFGPYEEKRKAFNAVIQGAVAELMKMAMIRLEREYPGRLLLQIHDSVTVELREDEVDELVPAIQRIMCEPFEEEFGLRFTSDAKQWGA